MSSSSACQGKSRPAFVQRSLVISHQAVSSDCSTGSIKERAEQMHKYLSDTLPKGAGVNFVAHSMGGLDVRHLISTIKPKNYTPLSVTTIGTPHHGSPFMDWCAANIGVGTVSQLAAAASHVASGLPFSLKAPLLARTEQAVDQATGGLGGFTNALSRHLLNVFDSPAYSNLTTEFCRNHFNPETPDDPSVKYMSVAGRVRKLSVLHPLWFTKLVLDAAAEKGYPSYDSGPGYEGNDGLVSVRSAKWGEFLGAVDDTHHWDLRGESGIWPNGLLDGEGKKKQKEAEKKGEVGHQDHHHHGKSDELVMSGGFDWEDGVQEYLGLNLAETKKDIKNMTIGGIASYKTSESGKDGKAKKSDDWDIAQVGQVLDWISDLIPGGDSTEAGKRQIAEARAETDAEEKRREEKGSRREGKSEKAAREKREQEDKFDLAKFYGGLMLKLREEGL